MILLTGGSGLLGKELKRLLPVLAPGRSELDITKPFKLPENVHLIVHSAAYTDLEGAERDAEEAYGVNVLGTMRMAEQNKPLVYISTEYVFDGGRGNYCEEDSPNPLNVYARTKLIGESMSKYAPRWLIIRTLFKPRPYKHPRAPVDQWTTGDYVDVIAPKIAEAIKLFEAEELEGIIHIGTEKKSSFDLARQTRQVEPISLDDIPMRLPRDTSLDTSKWASLGH